MYLTKNRTCDKWEACLATTTTLVAFTGTLVGFTAEHRSSSRQFLWSDLPEYATTLNDYIRWPSEAVSTSLDIVNCS